MSDRQPKVPPTAANVFANALASRHDYGSRAVEAGVHHTLECRSCGATRERDAEGPLVCRYCNSPLTHRGDR